MLAGLATVCWSLIYRWYALFDHASEPFFAFEKLPGQFDSPAVRATELLFIAVSVIYITGYWLLKGMPRISRAARLAVTLMVAGPAIINILLYPVGALDVFNYMAELKLTYYYDQNPYLTTIAGFESDAFTRYAFQRDIPLFYGPVWLLGSGIPALVVGFGDVVRLLLALKIFNLLLLLTVAVVIRAYQPDHKAGWLSAYIFVANPLVLFEGLANVHNDVMMTVFLMASLLAMKRQSILAAPLLTASLLVKLFTVSLAPVFVLAMYLGRWSPRKIAVTGLLSMAVLVIAFAPFWEGEQTVRGMLEGTRRSQEMDHVSPFSLAKQYVARQYDDGAVSLVTLAAVPTFVAGLGLIMWRMRRLPDIVSSATDVLLLFSLLLTNLYPWYLIPIVALLALRRSDLNVCYVFAATTLGLAYYPFYVYAHFNSGLSRLEVHLFLSLFLTVPMIVYLVYKVRRDSARIVASNTSIEVRGRSSSYVR